SSRLRATSAPAPRSGRRPPGLAIRRLGGAAGGLLFDRAPGGRSAGISQARLLVRRREWALLALLVTTSVLAVAAARERSIAEREAAAADAAAARSDWLEAVGHARAAAEAMLPGSPWPDQGFRRLEATGHDAEARGDLETALLAYGAMRTASLATRSILARNDAW